MTHLSEARQLGLIDIQPTCLANAANWHGVQAVKAYRRKDMDTYVRHVRVADQLWADVRDLG